MKGTGKAEKNADTNRSPVRSGITPYYSQNGVTIYVGDWRDISPYLPWDRISCILTDPPYGINYRRTGACVPLNPCRDGPSNSWSYIHPATVGDSEPFDPYLLLARRKPTLLWGANHYASRLPDTRGWLIWDKVIGDSISTAGCELAWTNFFRNSRVFTHQWSGWKRASERGEHYHPNQKPVALWNYILKHKWTPKDGILLDPYCGSGSLLVSAIRNGREAIGIEIVESYASVSASRCRTALDYPIVGIRFQESAVIRRRERLREQRKQQLEQRSGQQSGYQGE